MPAFGADLVDASLIGDTIENMVTGQEAKQTRAMMRAAVDAVIDELNLRLQAQVARPGSNVFLVDQRGVLKPADPGTGVGACTG